MGNLVLDTASDDRKANCALCAKHLEGDCDGKWITVQHGEIGYANTVARCPVWAATLKAKTRAEGLEAAGLTDVQYAQSWDQLDLDHQSWRVAHGLSQDLVNMVAQGINPAFVGPTGRGKTHAAMLICRDAMLLGFTALRLDWGRFLDGLRDGYSDRTVESESKKFERLTNVDLLLLDDIGSSGEDGNFSQKRLEKVFLRRYDLGKPTILTANFSPAGMADLLGERAASRVEQTCMWVTFSGTNYRGPERQQGPKDLMNKIWAGAR